KQTPFFPREANDNRLSIAAGAEETQVSTQETRGGSGRPAEASVRLRPRLCRPNLYNTLTCSRQRGDEAIEETNIREGWFGVHLSATIDARGSVAHLQSAPEGRQGPMHDSAQGDEGVVHGICHV
ncbi:hypothetical protein THAOC_30616, partial [Thalassiosira oceanica]